MCWLLCASALAFMLTVLAPPRLMLRSKLRTLSSATLAQVFSKAMVSVDNIGEPAAKMPPADSCRAH